MVTGSIEQHGSRMVSDSIVQWYDNLCVHVCVRVCMCVCVCVCTETQQVQSYIYIDAYSMSVISHSHKSNVCLVCFKIYTVHQLATFQDDDDATILLSVPVRTAVEYRAAVPVQ